MNQDYSNHPKNSFQSKYSKPEIRQILNYDFSKIQKSRNLKKNKKNFFKFFELCNVILCIIYNLHIFPKTKSWNKSF